MPEFPREPNPTTDAFPSAHGGVNSRQVSWNLQPHEVADLQDVDVSKVGVWTRRGAASAFGGMQDLPGGVAWFRKADGDVIGWAVFGNRITRSTFNGSWDVKASNVTLTENVLHMFQEGLYQNANFANNQYRAVYGCQCVPTSGTTEGTILFVFRGDNVANELESTQLTTSSGAHAPRVILYFQNRLWKANDQVSGDGNDLAWSELDDGLTYSPANELSIEPGVGGKITALLPARDSVPRIWVFKEEAIAFLEPKWGSSSALIPGLGDELDTIQSKVQTLTRGTGCIATKSCIWTPGLQGADVLFLARDGIRSLARASDDTVTGAGPPVSFNIPDWIDRINFASAHKATATFYDNSYHLAVPMDGAVENNYILRFDVIQRNWSLHHWEARDISEIPVAQEARFFFQNNFTTQDCSFTGAPASEYQIYRGYTGDIDPGNTAVQYFLETRAFVFQNPKVEKKWDRILFLGTVGAGETHDLRIVYRVDFQDWTTLASTVIIAVPDQDIIMGATPLPWSPPSQKLVQRRVSLFDEPPGTMLQFRFYGGEDFAKPELFYVDIEADHFQQIMDNTR